MKSVAFKAGDTILREGDEGDSAFVIVSGEVEVLIGPGGRRVVVLKAGDVFGEMCLIEPGPRSATIVALTDVECIATNYEEFISRIEDNPKRAIAFIKTLVRRLRHMNELMEKIDPNRRGLRGVVADYKKVAGATPAQPDATGVDWLTMI
jgi:CRP-like cAMP-binding protein